MMEDQYRTDTTEKIKDEDWCANCERWVDRWVVFFEPDSEGGYGKIRRCPHCKAKCYGDSSFSLGCCCFIVGFFTAPILAAALLSLLNSDIDPFSEGDSVGGVMLAIGVISGLVLACIGDRFEKQRWYRNRKAALQKRSLVPPRIKQDRF